MSADPIAMSGGQFRALGTRSAPLLWGAYFLLGLSTVIGIATNIVFDLKPNGLVDNLTWLGIAIVSGVSASLLSFQFLGSRVIAWSVFFTVLLTFGARAPVIAGVFSGT